MNKVGKAIKPAIRFLALFLCMAYIILGVKTKYDNFLYSNLSTEASAFNEKKPQAESIANKNNVIVSGKLFGIRLYSDGVIVTGFADIISDGIKQSPARDAGIKIGDRIIAVNGQKITINKQLAELVMDSDTVELSIIRENSQHVIRTKTIYDGECFRLGMWVKDSAAGIGTISYYDPSDKSFAGLGHGICDADTESLIVLDSGEPAEIQILGIEKAKDNVPGRIRGYFSSSESIGTITANKETGIYGKLFCQPEGELMEIADKSEVRTGEAQIKVQLDNTGVKSYEAKIESISTDKSAITKNFVIKITDKGLLKLSGGIIQGMSGCPVIQNGKLVGVITHVFINDSVRGFAIYAENMYMTQKNN